MQQVAVFFIIGFFLKKQNIILKQNQGVWKMRKKNGLTLNIANINIPQTAWTSEEEWKVN